MQAGVLNRQVLNTVSSSVLAASNCGKRGGGLLGASSKAPSGVYTLKPVDTGVETPFYNLGLGVLQGIEALPGYVKCSVRDAGHMCRIRVTQSLLLVLIE